ncbi:unnamed protein product, partial [Schistosoma mattheei]
GLLGYSSSAQPQLAGACLNCPPSQVQQINPLYQNNDFWPSEISDPTSTKVCSNDSPYDQSNIINHSLCKSKIHNVNMEALCFFTLHTPFLNLILINACSLLNKISALRTLAFLPKPSFILITETWCSQAVSDSELNIQNYRLYRCDRETKRGGCIIYALDTLTTNKVKDSVLNSLPESVWISVNTLNHSLLLGCIYRAPDNSNNGNDLIINAFIHASSLNFNAKAITGDFSYPGINCRTGSCQSCNDEFSAAINVHCWSQWVRNPTRGDIILDLTFSRDAIPLSVKVYEEFESSDHKIVVCAFLIYPSYNRPIQNTCQYSDYKHADWDLLHSLIKLSDWDNFFHVIVSWMLSTNSI